MTVAQTPSSIQGGDVVHKTS